RRVRASSAAGTRAGSSRTRPGTRLPLPHPGPALEAGEFLRTRSRDQLRDVEGDAAEVHGERLVVDERVLAERLEGDLVERLPVVPDEPHAADAEPELRADAPQPLQVHVPGRDGIGVDVHQGTLDLL